MPSSHRSDIIDFAREEARRMATIADQAGDRAISIRPKQFATLAMLIERLCDLAQDANLDPDAFDNFRFWVPLPQYEGLQHQLADLMESNRKLAREAELRDMLTSLSGNGRA